VSDPKPHPAFRHCGDFVLLSGFSGALIGLLLPHGGIRRVRKASATPEDSAKLRGQAKRQRQMSKLLAGVAAVPEILNEGSAEGCYWFDMEYVVGTDAVRYLELGSSERVEKLFGQIAAILDAHAGVSLHAAPVIHLAEIVAGKLDEIDSRTGAMHRAATDLIRARLSDVSVDLTPNFAHGDLTLENILVDRRQRLWLIDTIDSPCDHYWIDLAKLFQDIEGRWFQRCGRSLSLGVTWTLRKRLMRHAVALDQRYERAHPTLLALTFARILPYCQTEADRDFVLGKLLASLRPDASRTKEIS